MELVSFPKWQSVSSPNRQLVIEFVYPKSATASISITKSVFDIINFSVNEDENQDPNEYLSNYDYLFEEGNPFKKASSDENL